MTWAMESNVICAYTLPGPAFPPRLRTPLNEWLDDDARGESLALIEG
jgi:hypothetical protein